MTKRTVALAVVALALAAGCAKGVSPVGDEDAAINGEGDDRYSFVDTGTEPKNGPDADDPWTWDDAGFDAGQSPIDTGPTILDTGPTVIDTGARDTGARVDTGPCGRPGYPCCAGGMCSSGMCVSDLCAETPSCGMFGQSCCGTAACGPGLTCTTGRCTAMSACGGSGQSCCTSATGCLGVQTCLDGRCQPCGNPGQACCAAAPRCNAGLSCGSGQCRY